MGKRFSGRSALVTGGSSGIGLAAAHRLAAEGADLHLVAAPAHAAPLAAAAERLRELGGRVITTASDVAADGAASAAVDASLAAFGRLDLLVDNAGVGGSDQVLGAELDVFDEMMAVNVRGMYAYAIAAGRAMAAAGRGGAIVMTASSASSMGEERQVVYNTTKGAVAALARSLGVALARHGIRVNAVAPGYVLTDATRLRLGELQHWSNARSRIPMDRPGTAEEIGAVIAFLLSEDASYMTGSVVAVDGGHTAGWRNTDWSAVPVEDRAARPLQRWP